MISKLILKASEKGAFKLLNKFSLVGVVTTGLSFVLLYLLIDLFRVPLIPAYIVVYLSTIILSYLINSKYVFKSSYSTSDLVKYFVIYLSGMVIGIIVLKLYKSYIDLPHWLLSYMVIPVTFAWNFILAYKLLKK